MTDFDKIRFARGFAVASIDPGVPSHWKKICFGGYGIWIDPAVPHAKAVVGSDYELFVAGEALDCGNDTADLKDIAGRAIAALTQSERRFDEYTYYLAGRYILIYRMGTRVKIRSDAVATRTIFFSTRHPGLAASHAALVAEAVGASRRVHDFTQKPEFSRGVRHYPGRITPFDDVVWLSANTRLELGSLRVERYFPTENLPKRSTGEAAKLAAEGMAKVVRLATRDRSTVQSLTAGLDSRVALACSRQVAKKITYFTFFRSATPSQSLDVDVASAMCRTLRLRHVVLDRDRFEARVSQEELAEIRWNTYLSNASRLALAYRQELPGAQLHIRSNVGETGRSVFIRLYGRLAVLRPADMAHVWKSGLEDDPEGQQAFREFQDAVAFDQIRNYEPLDMLHWEHRIGAWHAMALNETDVAFPTISVYNSHFILDYLLSTPVEERISGRLFRAIIHQAWPRLNDWPINKPLPRTPFWRFTNRVLNRWQDD